MSLAQVTPALLPAHMPRRSPSYIHKSLPAWLRPDLGPPRRNPRADSLTSWSLLSSCERKTSVSTLSLSRRLSSREPPPEKWSWLRSPRDLDQLRRTDVPLLLCYLQVHLISILALRLGSSVKKVESFLGNLTDPLILCVLHVLSDMIPALTRAPLSRSTSSVNRGMN